MNAPSIGILTGRQFLLGVVVCLVAPGVSHAQVPMVGSGPNGIVRIFNTDSAILEMKEPRKDLPCAVTPAKATLGFDLRMHAGYEVSIPLKSLAGSENLLTIVFRVTPEGTDAGPSYFSQRIKVPPIEQDAGGDAYLQGSFDVGEGKYTVDWLMRDRTERVCSSYWDVEATLPARDRDIELVIQPGVVSASEFQPFKEEPPVARAQDTPPLNVKVLINFAPQRAYSAVLQPVDTSALVSILRGLSREPHIGKFSVVAFNLQEQRVIYRQDSADRIDFPALGEAVDSLNLGTVDLKQLSTKNADTQFLTDLIRREIAPESRPDALVFAGPKAVLEENVAADALRELGNVQYPVFYMNYNLNPASNPWRDTIGYAVRVLRGTEFTISRPRDLWFAVTDMVSRILKARQDRQTARAAGM